MLLIRCPHCGDRAQAEFTYERPAETVIALDAPVEAAIGTLYNRANPRGWSWELWRHTHGCGAWLRLHRHTATHEVAAVALLESGA
jgi:sarcosine oxidase subunit delta